MTQSRYSFAKAPIGGNNLDQADSSGDEAVQDMIRRTLESIDINDHSGHNDDSFEDVGYGTDDSWNVTRRRWARNKQGDNDTGTVTVVRRRRRPVVNRGNALANLPAVPWPLGNQGDLDSSQDGDSDDDEMAALDAEQTRQRTVDYFRSRFSQLSKDHSSQVSPDSVLTFSLASRAQRVRKSSSSPTATAAIADVTSTPSRSVTEQESQSPSSSSSSPVRRRGRRRHRPDLDSSLVQHVERARASVIFSSNNSNTIPQHPLFE